MSVGSWLRGVDGQSVLSAASVFPSANVLSKVLSWEKDLSEMHVEISPTWRRGKWVPEFVSLSLGPALGNSEVNYAKSVTAFEHT